MPSSDIEAETLSSENQRLRERVWRQAQVIYILLAIVAMALIVGAAFVAQAAGH